ncbi:hypothetical protein JFU37_13160 [Pseudomonas sp. TH41]|uniref:hypothetical protein n=1 Tax=Pseudomonas sp. TH41 TaxID=2796405 RepID=UPI001912F9D5|nr:hypothetical protein [Pseudomonas sp. TH41]MBK5353452.1 hypothetical protein [Pseudomonas sp. TH41]
MMPKITSLKGSALTAVLALSFGMFEASAAENTNKPGRCNSNFAYNTFVPTQVTPGLLEALRLLSGAAIVRHEKSGETYTQEYRSDRLRVISDEGNFYTHFQCG